MESLLPAPNGRSSSTAARSRPSTPVSSPEAAELTKLLENIFRSVNIALVNELAQLCDRMSIDVWEVIGAAATKPFGFMSFQPGPGLGGHCMPIDPFYLTWKAREYDFYTEFIELAGKVNENMPYWCLGKVVRALNQHEKALKGSKVLLLGVAYKSDIDDTRESPALKLIELLQGEGADVSYHDPFVPELEEQGLTSVPLDAPAADCVVIVTAHSGIDYDELVEQAPLVVDLRNATGPSGDVEREGVEALSPLRVGQAGLGYWGPNLARNFGELADLRWLCDLSPELLAEASARHPQARTTTDFEDLLADPELDAVVIATPVVTHFELARQALSAGKHVFVEKPQAQTSGEAEELFALAQERGLVLMPGYLLLYHPAVAKLKELVDAGELGDVLYLYGNRQNLGKIRSDENALWSLGAHDLAVMLHLIGEEPIEAWARGESYLEPGDRGRRLLLPALSFGGRCPHARLVARPAQDAQADRGRPREDGRLRRHGGGAEGDGLRQGAGAAPGDRVAGARGRHQHPAARARGAAAPRVRALPVARIGSGRSARAEPPGPRRRQGARVAPGIARDSRGLVARATRRPRPRSSTRGR